MNKYTVKLTCPHSERLVFKCEVTAKSPDHAILNARAEALRKGVRGLPGTKGAATELQGALL